MDLVLIFLIITTVNLIITTLIFSHFADIILERFKLEDKFDNSVVNSLKVICKQLDLELKERG